MHRFPAVVATRVDLAHAAEPPILDARTDCSPERVDVHNCEAAVALRRDFHAQNLAFVETNSFRSNKLCQFERHRAAPNRPIPVAQVSGSWSRSDTGHGHTMSGWNSATSVSSSFRFHASVSRSTRFRIAAAASSVMRPDCLFRLDIETLRVTSLVPTSDASLSDNEV